VFRATQSRLQIPTDVLFTRLAALRPGGALTSADEALRARFVNLESRLLYLQHGPAVLAECPFCGPDDPRSYLYYALPALAAPHLLNLVVLAVATSRTVAGASGAQWRGTATLGALALALADIYLVQAYNHQANARALRLGEIDFFFWTARAVRGLALAALNAGMATLIWLSATNRAFARPPSAAARVEGAVRALAGARSKLNAAAIVKNSVMREEELRGRSGAYWAHEAALVREVMEEREVVDGVSDALQNRLNIENMSRDAENYASSVIQPLQQQRAAASEKD
jgi:hypothetical protein